MIKPAKDFKKEQIKNANEMNSPVKKMVILNPIRIAILTPKESIENMASPRMGKTRDIVDSVTESSYCFKYAAI